MGIVQSSVVWEDIQSVAEMGYVWSLRIEIDQRCWNLEVSPNSCGCCWDE